jgi:hypothetical protein
MGWIDDRILRWKVPLLTTWWLTPLREHICLASALNIAMSFFVEVYDSVSLLLCAFQKLLLIFEATVRRISSPNQSLQIKEAHQVCRMISSVYLLSSN